VSTVQQGSLGGNTAKGKHGKTSVQKFGGLHALDFSIRLALQEGHRVKSEITGKTVRLSLGDFNKDSSGRAEFNKANGQKKECHGSLFNKDVVGIVGVRDRVNGIDGARETKSDSESTISGEPSEPSHHADTGVLDLGFSHPVEGRDSRGLFPRWRLDESSEILGDGGEVKRVEANITRHGSVKVDGARQERNRLGALGLVYHGVPHAVRHGLQFSGSSFGNLRIIACFQLPEAYRR